MQAGNDLVRNVGRGDGMANYRERSYLLGESAAFSAFPILWGEVDSGLYDGPSQAPTCHRTGD